MARTGTSSRTSTARSSGGGRKTRSKQSQPRRKTAASSVRKGGASKRSARSSSNDSSTPRYGRKASEKVERAMHEMKRGELRSGRSGKKVTSREQAIAIGLSEARREGGKV